MLRAMCAVKDSVLFEGSFSFGYKNEGKMLKHIDFMDNGKSCW